MKMKNLTLAVAAVAIMTTSALFPKRANAQELSAQIVGGSYKNGTEQMVGLGFAAKKPLNDKITAGFDLTFAVSKSKDIVESAQIWASFKLGGNSNISLTPYLWKNNFYGVDPYGVGLVASLGNIDVIGEYDKPKTAADPNTFAEAVCYKLSLGKLNLFPKLIGVQFSNKVFDMLGLELKASYNAGRGIAPFVIVKTMDLLETGKCSTNLQGGMSVQL